MAEEIFTLGGNDADDICNILNDEVDDMSDHLDRSNPWNDVGGSIMHSLFRMAIGTEVCSFTNTFDRKGRRPCMLIDLDNIGKERR